MGSWSERTMPNGHGGDPRFAKPGCLLILLGLSLTVIVNVGAGRAWIPVTLCVVFAIVFGWLLAYDIHMWDADADAGNYTPNEEWWRACRRCVLGALVYSALAAGLTIAVLWLCGVG